MTGKTNALVSGGGIDDNTIYVSKFAKTIESAFNGQYSVMRNAEVTLLISSNAVFTTMSNSFNRCQAKTITINGSTGTVTNFSSAFKENGTYLTTIDGDGLDFSSATNVGNIFQYTTGIETLIIKANTLGISLDLSYLQNLNNDSLASIVAGLKDMTGQTSPTLTLHATPKANLTAEQLATISVKNWTLS